MTSSRIINQKETILSLIRLGIHHSNSYLPERIDWESLEALVDKQGLSAIVLDGVQVLNDRGDLVNGRSIDAAIKKRWIATVIHGYEQRFLDYRKQVGELARFHSANGFKLMILKGYGLNLNYPIPQHRPCGDIDIWTFGRCSEADAAISKDLSIIIDNSHHHHTVYHFNGFTVENHCDFVNIHYGHKNAELESIFKKMAEDDSSHIEIDGQVVYLPSPNLNALFLLRHTMLHFASTSMNLRQILDWGFFIHKFSTKVDWKWLLGILEEYHMIDFFACLNAICVEDLGFDASLFPAIQIDTKLKERVLDDIISPEFTSKLLKDKGLISRVAFKYRRWKANKWKYQLCYGDNRLWSFLVSVWAHLVKPSMI